jgi:hypothetical protein
VACLPILNFTIRHSFLSQSTFVKTTLRESLIMCTLIKFKLVFFVPPSALQACKSAIFAAGAGSFPGTGGYSECCFTSKGTGQFRPGDAANPHVSPCPIT